MRLYAKVGLLLLASSGAGFTTLSSKQIKLVLWSAKNDEKTACGTVEDTDGWVAEGDEEEEEILNAGLTALYSRGDEDGELRRLLRELEFSYRGTDAKSMEMRRALQRTASQVLEEKKKEMTSMQSMMTMTHVLDLRGSIADKFLLAQSPLLEHQNDDDEPEDEHTDAMYGWMIANTTSALALEEQKKEARFEEAHSGDLAVGIDLGTTNSAVAVVIDGEARIVPPGLMPSVVCYIDAAVEGIIDDEFPGDIALRDDGGDGIAVVVGSAAEDMREGPHALSVCSRVKRVLGRTATLAERRRVGYEEVTGKAGSEVLLSVPALPHKIAASDVSAELVRALRSRAAAYLKAELGTTTPLRRCVVGVPARFDDSARAATSTACILGGFEQVELVTEPEAAALAYGALLRRSNRAVPSSKTVLVFDLGGGTLDLSVVALGEDEAELLALGGDAKLGGDDFDGAIAEFLAERFAGINGVSVVAQTARLRLLQEAERCKKELSQCKGTTATARNLARADASGRRSRSGKPLDLCLPVTRRGLELIVRPLLKRIEAHVREVLDEAGCYCADDGYSNPAHLKLERVLLVGGSSRMPVIGRMLKRLTGLPLTKIASMDVHPDEAVALGAAVRAATLDKLNGIRKDDAAFDIVKRKAGA